jgi:hypothetical protein
MFATVVLDTFVGGLPINGYLEVELKPGRAALDILVGLRR